MIYATRVIWKLFALARFEQFMRKFSNAISWLPLYIHTFTYNYQITGYTYVKQLKGGFLHGYFQTSGILCPNGSLPFETSAFSLASLSGPLVRHYMKSLLFFQTSDRGWPACGRLGRQTSARTKTSARLKITFVDMTYPRGWTGSIPLCPRRFLLNEPTFI